MNPNKFELLAPAGDMERLETALRFGADAVYVGGPMLQLRAANVGFTMETLAGAVQKVHAAGKKIYVTVNAFASNGDVDAAGDYARRLYEMGVDAVVMNRFTPETAQTPAEEFLHSLCRDLKPVVLAAGFNHSFGYKGEGNADMLRKMAGELGYKALILEPVERDGGPVSSSRIRMLLQEGRFQEAERLLGREE